MVSPSCPQNRGAMARAIATERLIGYAFTISVFGFICAVVAGVFTS